MKQKDKLLRYKLSMNTEEYGLVNGYFIPEKYALEFKELCRRVVKRDNFSEYATKLWKEIFNGK